MLNSKQDEVLSLNKQITSGLQLSASLGDTITELEEKIRDTEEKNKKLVDLLNSNIYNKAEQYKEKVLSKLQERQPMATPNKLNNSSLGPSSLSRDQTNSEASNKGLEPSPVRL